MSNLSVLGLCFRSMNTVDMRYYVKSKHTFVVFRDRSAQGLKYFNLGFRLYRHCNVVSDVSDNYRAGAHA